MTMTDPIADMLTRMRNALRNKKESVDVPASTVKIGILNVLKREGYIGEFKVVDVNPGQIIRIYLKYGSHGEDVITGIERVSKPGCRIYKGSRDLPRVLDGLGIAVVSSPKGMLSDRECRRSNVGGEVVCTVW
ncbi:MAG: 30S ribosomal protein S8 [Planctomycetes bacterium]|nr:30S ribosomal protein S8 [Planctomycetota bacterium]